MKRTSTLEEKIYELEGRLLITENVNCHLENQWLTQLLIAQYSRRPCLVINRMAETGNESDDEKLVTFTLIRRNRNRWVQTSPGKIFVEENYSSPGKYFVTFPGPKFSPIIFDSNHFLTFFIAFNIINQWIITTTGTSFITRLDVF